MTTPTQLAADSAELMRWKGRTLLPRNGCLSAFMPLGNASVWTEYELHDDRAVVLQVLINGQLIEAEDWLHPSLVESWGRELWDMHKERKTA